MPTPTERPFPDIQIPSRGSCAAHVAAHRHGELLSALGTETHYAEEEALYRAGFRDAAFVPLFLGGELQGVVIVGRSEVNSLEARSIRCLEKVSGLLAALLAASLQTETAAPPARRGSCLSRAGYPRRRTWKRSAGVSWRRSGSRPGCAGPFSPSWIRR